MSFQDAPGHPKRRLIVTLIVLGLMTIGVFVALTSVLNAPEGGIAGEAEELVKEDILNEPPESELPESAPSPNAAEPVAATVVLKETLRFEPSQVTIRAGESVRWINDTNFLHTVTLEPEKATDRSHVELPEGAANFSSEELGYGETFVHKFEVPGLYRYFCMPHEMKGMVGEIFVEPVSDGPGGADGTDAGGGDDGQDAGGG